ncbi:MAG: T9SS type A sorting domain-containing protein [Bacteroidales bacterium]|jgi:hypothetical protein|nr:T9SS type A sorting domain-containing protein [Bacteroidales bacterium]
MKRLFLFCFLFTVGCMVFGQGQKWFVKNGGSAANSGNSWANASDDLQGVINNAAAGDTVLVAEGSYIPIRAADNLLYVDSNNRDNAFVLKNNIKIFGGFSANDTTFSQRNWTKNKTVLSGNLNDSTRCYHVVIATDNLGNASLDGFTVSGGYANGTGNVSVNTRPVSRSHGGGIYCRTTQTSQLQFTNLIITDNATARNGGGVYNSYASPAFTNVLISNNIALDSGGAMYNSAASSLPVLTNVTVTQNKTGKKNSIHNTSTASPKIRNSIIWGNTKIDGITPSDTTATGNPVYANSLMEGSTIGNGIILNGNPSFVDPANGDYRLSRFSVAIDVGDNSFYLPNATPDLSLISTDMLGKNRFHNGTIDLGAYECTDETITPNVNGIVYVNRQATTGNGSGDSWQNATTELADALYAAKTDAVIRQIWVATATYYPLYNATDNSTGNGGRNNAFVLAKNVQVYGGFAGNETNLSQRNWENHSTVLSGDIGITGDSTDNCYHVIISAGDVGIACLDGFIISGGNADNNQNNISVNGGGIYAKDGGGIANVNSSPLYNNLQVKNNYAEFGAGIYIDGLGTMPGLTSPRLTNMKISENYAHEGSGIYCAYSSPVLEKVIITENHAYEGGGIVFGNSVATLKTVIISKNRAELIGGIAVTGNDFSWGFSIATLTNVLITENVSEYNTGSVYASNAGLFLTNVTVCNNSGGGIIHIGYLNNPAATSCTIHNSIVWGNKGVFGENRNILRSVIYLSNFRFQNSLIGGDTVGNGVILNEDPLFADTANGNYRLSFCSPAINVGNNAFYSPDSLPDLSSITTDLDNNQRICNGTVDLGVYEFERISIQAENDTTGHQQERTICYGDTTTVVLHFAGHSPWELIYTTDDGNSFDTIKSIFDSLYRWKISPLDTTSYQFIKMQDNNCSHTLTDTIQIDVLPNPVFTNNLSNDTLCSGDYTRPVAFTGTATRCEWIASGDMPDSIPAGIQTGNFGRYKIENKGNTQLSSRITLTPVYEKDQMICTGKDTSFSIFVLPEPKQTTPLQNDTLCSGEYTRPVVITGTATHCKWIADGDIPDSIPTGIQTGNFGRYKVVNKGNTPLSSRITLTPGYMENQIICTGKDTSFSIFVLPEPIQTTPLQNDTLCSGEQTKEIVFAGTSSTAFQWTVSGTLSGFPSGTQTGNFGKYTIENNDEATHRAVVTITPLHKWGGKTCMGAEDRFSVFVYPQTKIHAITSNKSIFCEDEPLELMLEATGEDVSYQWYQNNNSITGATGRYYALSEISLDDAGDYYAEATGKCGTDKSQNIYIVVNSNKLLVEKWNDVIFVDNSTNEYTGYQWYKNSRMIVGATNQFYQELGGLNGCYSVRLTLQGGSRMHSCERCMDKTDKSSFIIYPNPVQQNNSLQILLYKDNKIYNNVVYASFYTFEGKLLKSVQSENGDFRLETVSFSSGMYILKVTTNDNITYTEKIIIY